jgi:hypothetical protein
MRRCRPPSPTNGLVEEAGQVAALGCRFVRAERGEVSKMDASSHPARSGYHRGVPGGRRAWSSWT